MTPDQHITVKFCGLSQEDDVQTACSLGAEYVGFVFHAASPRNIAPGRAAVLASLLETGMRSVAVMVDPTDTFISEMLPDFQPDFFQLHGNESPDRVSEIAQRYGVRIIKAIQVETPDDIALANDYADADMLLFDAKPPRNSLPLEGGGSERGCGATSADAVTEDSHPHPNLPPSRGKELSWLPGGNGLSFNWTMLKDIKLDKPWFLSGGLTAQNVADAIAQSGAAMVDVSSGIERAPGIKDKAKMEAFMQAVNP